MTNMDRTATNFLIVLFLLFSTVTQAELDKGKLVSALISAAIETNDSQYNQSIKASKEKLHAAIQHFDTTYDGGENGPCDKMSKAVKNDINNIEKVKSKREQMKRYEKLASEMPEGIKVCNKVSAAHIAKKNKPKVKEKAPIQIVRGKDIANTPDFNKTAPIKSTKPAKVNNNAINKNANAVALSKKVSKCAGAFKQVYERSMHNCRDDYRNCSNTNNLRRFYTEFAKQANQLHRLDKKEEQKGYDIAQTISTPSMVNSAVSSEGDYAKLIERCMNYASKANQLIKQQTQAKYGNNAVDHF